MICVTRYHTIGMYASGGLGIKSRHRLCEIELYRILVVKLGGKRPLGRRRLKFKVCPVHKRETIKLSSDV
jgi:hypothetical protein